MSICIDKCRDVVTKYFCDTRGLKSKKGNLGILHVFLFLRSEEYLQKTLILALDAKHFTYLLYFYSFSRPTSVILSKCEYLCKLVNPNTIYKPGYDKIKAQIKIT